VRMRFSGLDGLRGIAVLIVVLYHAGLWQIPGGFLGVDIFFVLSGFLITSLLLDEATRTGALDRANFYLRRLRRIVPALISILIFAVVAAALWAPDAAYGVRRDLPWALTSVLNWSYLFFNQSYFVNISRPPLLQHLWSLSIEEQYYAVWPLIVLACVKTKWLRGHFRSAIFVIAGIGALASTLWMRWLAIKDGYPVPNDPSRIYFGTDTHAMGLLVGSALAAAVRPERFKVKITPDKRTALNALAIGSASGLAYYIMRVNELDESLFRGGFLIVSLLTAGLILASVHPGLVWGRLLDNSILRWFGRRSYGIYLWHWPIFMLLRPGVDVNWPEPVVFGIRISLVILISALSYRYLELPIRNGELKKTWIRWRALGVPRPNPVRLVVSLGLTGSFLFCLVSVSSQPMPTSANTSAFGGITTIDLDPSQTPEPPQPSQKPKPSGAMPLKHGKVVVFGDSVVLSGRVALQANLKSMSLDAAVGRQPWEIAQRIKIRRSEDRLSSFVVIHMGTNGLVTRRDLEPILRQLKDRKRVVVVDVQVPRVWMKQTNKMIYSLVPKYKNVRLATWHLASRGHSNYFTSDGVHLTPAGGKVFARIIRQALQAP